MGKATSEPAIQFSKLKEVASTKEYCRETIDSAGRNEDR